MMVVLNEYSIRITWLERSICTLQLLYFNDPIYFPPPPPFNIPLPSIYKIGLWSPRASVLEIYRWFTNIQHTCTSSHDYFITCILLSRIMHTVLNRLSVCLLHGVTAPMRKCPTSQTRPTRRRSANWRMPRMNSSITAAARTLRCLVSESSCVVIIYYNSVQANHWFI